MCGSCPNRPRLASCKQPSPCERRSSSIESELEWVTSTQSGSRKLSNRKYQKWEASSHSSASPNMLPKCSHRSILALNTSVAPAGHTRRYLPTQRSGSYRNSLPKLFLWGSQPAWLSRAYQNFGEPAYALTWLVPWVLLRSVPKRTLSSGLFRRRK